MSVCLCETVCVSVCTRVCACDGVGGHGHSHVQNVNYLKGGQKLPTNPLK